MINSIIGTFRTQARQHRTIKAFYHGRNYELGSGKESYPLLWLEDPMYGQNRDNVFVSSVNFAILFLPRSAEMTSQMQNLAFSIGLNILERIKKEANSPIRLHPDWTYTTLSDYYDDNACGCRFSANFTQLNMQNFCLIDEQFDNGKEFGNDPSLHDFTLHPSTRHEVFEGKFPEFNLRTRK